MNVFDSLERGIEKAIKEIHNKERIQEYREKYNISEKFSKRKWKKISIGKYEDNFGYIKLYKPKHLFSDKSGWIFEHRLVMEKKLGRYLKPKEVIHHKNRIRNDNRIENLKLFRNQEKHLNYHRNKSELNYEFGKKIDRR